MLTYCECILLNFRKFIVVPAGDLATVSLWSAGVSQIKTVIWQKECCIWHIIVSRSLLAAKSHQPNRMENYFPLLKMVKHLDEVISTSIENCFRLWSFFHSPVESLNEHIHNVWTSIGVFFYELSFNLLFLNSFIVFRLGILPFRSRFN